MAVRCGTCAWADHTNFYPRRMQASDKLHFYAQYFPLVEIDSTFYGIPSPTHAINWVKQTPEAFTFDVKAYRTLTRHDRGQASPEERAKHADAFAAVLDVLAQAGKLGAVLFQFPPWFVCTRDNVEYIESLLDRFSEYLNAVEFRNRSWWDDSRREQTSSWLRARRAVNVVCDEPQVGMGTVPFVPDVTSSEMVVFRLHGRNAETWYQKGLTSSQQRFDYKYSVAELESFLPYVEGWSQQAADVHVLMNNNQGDYAVTNALDWMNILGQPVKSRPSVAPEQLTLFDEL